MLGTRYRLVGTRFSLIFGSRFLPRKHLKKPCARITLIFLYSNALPAMTVENLQGQHTNHISYSNPLPLYCSLQNGSTLISQHCHLRIPTSLLRYSSLKYFKNIWFSGQYPAGGSSNTRSAKSGACDLSTKRLLGSCSCCFKAIRSKIVRQLCNLGEC